jgi:hypothetical protein
MDVVGGHPKRSQSLGHALAHDDIGCGTLQ